MDLRTIECPACETGNQFYLSADDERHLRRCPDCGRWFVAVEDADPGDGRRIGRVVDLDDPPACPVEGCSESPPADELPAHVIAVHDGSLTE